MVSPTSRRPAAWTLWSLLFLFAWDASGLDLALARLSGGPHGFALQDHWLLATVLHQDALPLTWLLVAWLSVGVVFPTFMQKRLDVRARLQWAASAWLPLLLVNLLKLTSTTSCPWDLAEFGWVAHYVSHWAWTTADGGSGHCFPAGHASAGFIFMSGYFVWQDRDRQLARRWLVAGLLAGGVLGGSQQLRGAHYLSHTLWTGWICWTTALAVSFLAKAIPASASSTRAIHWPGVGFWSVIVLSRTLGETGGDALSTTLHLGYASATAVFALVFALLYIAQRQRAAPGALVAWAALVASTMAGTTIADSLSETAGIGTAGTVVLLLATLAILFGWRYDSFRHVRPDQSGWSGIPLTYWAAAVLASTLGVAVADWVGAGHRMGLVGGSLLFSGAIGAVAAVRLWKRALPSALFFWPLYLLAGPLGATLGDALTNGPEAGGFAVNPLDASFAMTAILFASTLLLAWWQKRRLRP